MGVITNIVQTDKPNDQPAAALAADPALLHCVYLTPVVADFEEMSRLLGPAPLRVHHARRLADARAVLRSTGARVLISDVAFEGGDWRDALAMTALGSPGVAVIVTSARIDERFWINALESGAYDVLVKPFMASELRRILENAQTHPGWRAAAIVA